MASAQPSSKHFPSSSHSTELDIFLSLIHNYKVMIEEVKILDKSHRTEAASWIFHAIFEFNVPKLEKLADQYGKDKTWLKGDVNTIHTAIQDLQSLRSSEKGGKKPPERLTCPLQTLLKLAVERGHILFDLPDDDSGWDRLTSFQSYLSKLGEKFSSAKGSSGNFCPGLPACVLAHTFLLDDPLHWHYVISGSAPRYDDLKTDLGKQWKNSRNDWINFYLGKCPGYVRSQWRTFRRASDQFDGCAKEQKSDPKTRDSTGLPLRLPGVLATWSPTGRYMTACRLDYFRFEVRKPPNAEKEEETRDEADRKFYGTNSCAEWAGFVEWCCLAQKWPTAFVKEV